MSAQVALEQNHPFMVAWREFTSTAEYANALKWALADKYDDGREISAEMQRNHVEGALWLAFTKGLERNAPAERTAEAKALSVEPTCIHCGKVEYDHHGKTKRCQLRGPRTYFQTAERASSHLTGRGRDGGE